MSLSPLLLPNRPAHLAKPPLPHFEPPSARASHHRATQKLEIVWAQREEDIRAAQRLRYAVFAGEMGARLNPPEGSPPGHDIDHFDAYCEHLLVRTIGTDHEPGTVIGTYRVLTPAAATRAGGWYSETEFDLAPLRPLRERMVEVGRFCIHPAWRTGGAVLALWGALGRFMERNQFRTMVGCASVAMDDGGHLAASLWDRVRQTHLAPIEWQVQPLLPLPLAHWQPDPDVRIPTLIKGYLRLNCKVLGPPALDPDFNTADLPILLQDLADMPRGHVERFIGA